MPVIVSRNALFVRFVIAAVGLAGLTLGPSGCAAASRSTAPAMSTDCRDESGWDVATPPRQLFGNTYYVGHCGVSAVLIAGSGGHVLLDGTTGLSAARVAANVRALGLRIEDVRYIATSHAHMDHVGGVAELQRLSGATVLARDPDAAALERGRGDRRDPQFASVPGFAPVAAVRRVSHLETISLGGIELRAIATPGHTPGGTSWVWRSCAGARCLDVVYADSLSAISDDDYRYSDSNSNPGALDAFRTSIETVAALPCDLLLTAHPQSSQMWLKLAAGDASKLIDAGACRRYAEFARQALNARVAREAAQ